MAFDDEERFYRLFQAIENVIQEVEEGEGKLSDGEIMQALDFVGFNLFRDDWEEFKKMELNRDLSSMNFRGRKGKNLLH
ncbi:MAG: hypothetical protein ACE5GQ_04320 [Nitrospinales bacterium]